MITLLNFFHPHEIVVPQVQKKVAETVILDKRRQLARFDFWDNQDWSWYEKNIPFWESPDQEIDKTYYYRWELITKHRVYGSPESGYSFTEFINRPPWSGRYGAISCAMGLQLYELRWLKDPEPLRDYAKYWHHTPGAQPLSYSNWFGDGLWNVYAVNGDRPWILSMLPDMEAQYQGWMREHWRPEMGMFAWAGMHDGMETNIESRQTKDWFAGAENYRPTLNAYVYGDLVALSKTAALKGDRAKEEKYRNLAQNLKEKVESSLWDPKRRFFSSRFSNDEEKDGVKIAANTLLYDDGKYKGSPYGRQLIGYVPWMFNLPSKNKGYEEAWKGVVDPKVFFAPHGLYTVERNDPQFTIAPTSCVWSGNNWPFAQAQTIQAMANVLNDYPQKTVSKADYFKVFQNYTLTQRENGRPYLAETSDPDTGRWTFDEPNKSEHYFHSSYNDLLITGLAGLRPRADNVVEVNPLAPERWDYFALDDVAYHGHRLSVVWDRTGLRYKRGKGLSVWVDGNKAASRPTLGKLLTRLPSSMAIVPKKPTNGPFVNVAVNNDSAYFPRIRATSTAPKTSVGNLYDGVSYYHAERPVNRWVSSVSSGAQHIEFDFGTARTVSEARLYILDDGIGSLVRAPRSIHIEQLVGSDWKKIPGQKLSLPTPMGHRANALRFPPVSASKLRVVLSPQENSAVGLSELEIWGSNPLPLKRPNAPDNLARRAKASSSYTSPFDHIEEINDGQIVMAGGRNRWTAYQSPNQTDWVQLDFPQAVTIGRLSLCLFGDDGEVRMPKSYTIEYWESDAWHRVAERSRDPEAITRNIPNDVAIQPVTTRRIRVTFEHDGRGRSGLTELLVFER